MSVQCHGLDFGHAAGVFGGAIPVGNYPCKCIIWFRWLTQRYSDEGNAGTYRLCLSNFGIGSGYYQMSAGNDEYAINAHYWGNGNEDVFT